MTIRRLTGSVVLMLLCGVMTPAAHAESVDLLASTNAQIAELRREMIDALRHNNHREWVMARRELDALRNRQSRLDVESDAMDTRTVPELLSSAESLTLDEYVSIAKQFSVPAYRIVDHDVHVLSQAQALTPLGADFGEPGFTGTIESGLLMNTSDEIVFIAIGDSLEQGFEPFQIRPGELIAVRMIDSDDVGASGTGCRVACTDGYFACCSFGDCSCNKNELEATAPCLAGGPHATGCHLGTTDTPVRKRRQ